MSLLRSISSLLLPALLAVPALWPMRAAAQEVGGYAGAYLRRALTAGNVGMGGAFVPFVSNGDGSAIFNNSAALARLDGSTLLFSFSTAPIGATPLGDQSQQVQSLGFGMRAGEFLGIGIGVVNVGGIESERYNANEELLGTIATRDLAFSVGAGMAIGPANIGATVRYLKFIVPDDAEPSPGGYSIDLDGTWEFESVLGRRDWLAFAASVDNLAGEMTNVHDIIPPTIHFGGAYLYPLGEDLVTASRLDPTGLVTTRRSKPRAYILGSLETHLAQHDTGPIVSAALEWVPQLAIPIGIRVGADTRSDLAGGFFVSIPSPIDFARTIRLDFASRRDYELGNLSHHVSITAGF